MEKRPKPLWTNFDVPTWDICQTNDDDRQLRDFGEVLEVIEKMPLLDKHINNYSQYENIEHLTACTMYSSINALSSITNIKFTKQDIEEIIEIWKERWWKPGNWWNRSSWVDVVRTRWNNKYPDNKVISFVVEYWTPEFNTVIDRLGTAVWSLSVDWSYWKDVRDNLKVDKDIFKRLWWHATCVMNTGEYICIDSVPQSVWKDNVKMPMIYTWWDKFELLVKRSNIKKDFHIFIMENRLKQELSDEERTRLENFRNELNKAIEANSAIRHLTTQEEERQERKKMNDYNRAKLKIIESMLG